MWFSRLQTEDQWHGSLYKINTRLKCYDFVHRLTSKTPAALRLLHLSHIEYLRLSLCIAGGEYVPVEVIDEHESLLTCAVRWKCVTCGKEPVGDNHAHTSHTRDRRFSARANNICDKHLAHVVDQVKVHLQQMQDCINQCFGNGSGDPRDSMTRLGDLKAQALQTWEEFLEDDRAWTLRERPFGSYPITTWAVLWPLTKRARGDMSKWTGYARHFESCLHYLNGRCWIPAVMCERLAHTGHAMIAATLADMRKQSSGSSLPAFLKVPKTNDWCGPHVGRNRTRAQTQVAT